MEMLPLLLNKLNLRTFKFWQNGKLHDGLCHNNELFFALRVFDSDRRVWVQEQAAQLSQQGIPVIVTYEGNSYTIWVRLRSSAQVEAFLNLPSEVADSTVILWDQASACSA
ncbi:hypothetical protein OOK60_02415 [Trichothermofontia sichuanensis B231]|uniref:hypothetical protein n=1 Tax=Trichothermofontia sichuanensis TaxID=3045816 RepID=UPI0022476306|nr:hypothetical protein [Trichothermofontia sichuanensis]UZQ54955.1 hypothetical protein OOK60_02415 [Trichothermofontia sichuanensis B231]